MLTDGVGCGTKKLGTCVSQDRAARLPCIPEFTLRPERASRRPSRVTKMAMCLHELGDRRRALSFQILWKVPSARHRFEG